MDFLPNLNCAVTTDESMAINRIKSGAIIIAGSGIAPAGVFAITSSSASGTHATRCCSSVFRRATRSAGYWSMVRNTSNCFRRTTVKARIETLGGFGACGSVGLMRWIGHFEGRPRGAGTANLWRWMRCHKTVEEKQVNARSRPKGRVSFCPHHPGPQGDRAVALGDTGRHIADDQQSVNRVLNTAVGWRCIQSLATPPGSMAAPSSGSFAEQVEQPSAAVLTSEPASGRHRRPSTAPSDRSDAPRRTTAGQSPWRTSAGIWSSSALILSGRSLRRFFFMGRTTAARGKA